MPLSYYRGCWHEIGRDFLLVVCHNLSTSKGFYNQYSLHHPRDIAGSGFRPLSNIPHCCRSKAFGPCLSPNVADHPLRSAKDLRLGRLLPYQLPNPTQAHLTTSSDFFLSKIQIFLSLVCEVDSYALLTRSPLLLKKRDVQLACVKLIASVHSEPGSNSYLIFLLLFCIFIQFFCCLFLINRENWNLFET